MWEGDDWAILSHALWSCPMPPTTKGHYTWKLCCCGGSNGKVASFWKIKIKIDICLVALLLYFVETLFLHYHFN